ncbi:Hypothetical predicted protein [Paramuricea clavata]|uniref:Tc1-like transposase DDE domain-containing protein n=1 Tax=Paramuricea clavata TaxID=317549 RepID=A0A7D9EW73_PARCT|nr:Hypothetical predicted protein [Paramuricea clavata]
MDNDQSQTSKAARKAIEKIEAEFRKIPARSPDLKPIENVFHLVKESPENEAIAGNITIVDPYFDKNSHTLRVGGRLKYSDLLEATKYPVIIPHGHPIKEKIIQKRQQELLHAGLK